MKKFDKPLLLWIALWIVGQTIIGIRNDLTLMGRLSSFQDTIIASLYINLILIPIALIFWFLMKFIFKRIDKPEILAGTKAQKNVLKIWLVLFLVIFIIGFLNK